MPALRPFTQNSALSKLYRQSTKMGLPAHMHMFGGATLLKWHKANQRFGLLETTLYDRLEVRGLGVTYFYFRDRNWDRK